MLFRKNTRIMRIFNLVRRALVLNTICLCIWLIVYSSVEGSDIDCTVDCACCIDRVCGPMFGYPNSCTKGCIDGYAGARCYNICPKNCKNCTLTIRKLNCSNCFDGFFPGPSNDCISECLPNCKTCTSGSSCTSCNEDYYNDNGSKDCRYRKCPENCKCINNQCASCKEGFYNTSNLCNSLCTGNCVTCSLSTDCDSCKDGHYNGYQYGNSSLPLLKDCTYKCQDNCVQCTTYGLCSVCKTGRYGSICEKNCSAGCITGRCDIQTGTCACFPNFTGDKCNKCQNGKYGDMCDKLCPAGCKSNECDKESGKCTNGCLLETIIGDKCDVCTTGCANLLQKHTVIVLGTIVAVSIMGNIILAAAFILLNFRQRVITNKEIRQTLCENADIEQKGEALGNDKDNHRIVQASNFESMTTTCDYDVLGIIQGPEHEYEKIRQFIGFNK